MSSEHHPRELLGRFKLVRQLGSGGMGVVYEALDAATGARVALKTLHEQRSSFLLQLKREFRTVHGLKHPNLVELGELFQAGERWFFTMELVEGQDYTSWLHAADPASGDLSADADVNAPTLNAAETTALLASAAARLACRLPRITQSLPQLASALVDLHGAGLVHGDIKPSNVLMTAEGRLVLLDFGLVRSTLDEHQSAQFAGTIAYMAPEQADAGAISPAVDCYAFGVVLYEALTGRVPFVGTAADVLIQKRSWAPVQPSLLVPGVPNWLEQLCLELLDRDAHARPAAAQILARLAQRSLPRASTPASPARAFVGRMQELRRIADLFDALAEGQPSALLLHGESGIGKTALLQEACRQAREASAQVLVLRGRCFERETVAYAGLDMLIDVLASTLRRLPAEHAAYFLPRYSDLLCQLFPTLATVPGFGAGSHTRLPMSSHEARTRARAAFHELFARLCMRYRVVLVVDDAQWLSDESRALLAALFLPEERLPLALLLASRPSSAERLRAWLETLACPLSELFVGPLAAHESVELLRQYPLAADGPALSALASDGAGHPLFLHELAEAARAGTAPQLLQLDACLRGRASGLSARHQDVLELVCAGARPMASEVIAAAARIPQTELASILRDLQSQRFLVTERNGAHTSLQPLHDRVRQALLEALADESRRELQRRLACALEEQDPVDVDALALQWSAAGDHERGAGFARQAAAHAVSMLAFERALDLYALSLRASALPAAERGAIFAAKGEALANLGRGAEAAAAYLEATRHCAPDRIDELVLRGADQLIRSGRVDDGRRLMERVLERLDIELPRSQASALRALVLGRVALKLTRASRRTLSAEERARQLRRIDACWTVGDLLGLVDPIRSADLHTRGLRFAIEVGEPVRLARSLASDAWFVSSSGARAWRSALERLRQAEGLIQNQASSHTDGWITLCRGIVMLQMGDFQKAQRELDASEAVFERRCQGAFFEASYAREFAVWALAYRGELRALLQRMPRAIELASVTDNRLALLRLRCGPSHVALLAADEPQQLVAAASAGMQGLSQETYPFPHLCTLFARVHAAIYLGRAADALSAIQRELRKIEGAQLLRNQFFRIDFAGLRARAALAALAGGSARGTAGRLADIARRSARELRRERVAWATALAAGIDASLQTLERGAPRSAAAALNDAADQLAGSGLGLYADALRYQTRRFAMAHGLSVGREPASDWSDSAVVARPERLAQTFAPLPAS